MNEFFLTEQGGKLVLEGTPYFPDANVDYRKIGGDWKSGPRHWVFDARDRDRLREILCKHFGHDDRPYATVDARIELGSGESDPQLWRFGRLIAERRSRDWAVTLGPGVVIVEGRFAGRGGSVKYPAIGDTEGVILEVRDIAAAHADLTDEDVTIVRSDTDTDTGGRPPGVTAAMDRSAAAVRDQITSMAESMARARADGIDEHGMLGAAVDVLNEDEAMWPRGALCVLAAAAVARLPEAQADRAH